MAPRITVGLPVYKGSDLIADCLGCLQRQTYSDFEVIISVDGADLETATACHPFLADARFRLIVQPSRLDWVGNFNWLIQQNMQEFFCYRQHDDTTAPEFFEVLLQAAAEDTDAAAVYSDCQFHGARHHIECAPSIEGPPEARMLTYLRTISSAAPIRGLIRTSAVRQAGLVRTDQFRAPMEVFVWLAKLLRCGNFRRVAEPLYYRLDHPRSFEREFKRLPPDQRSFILARLISGLLEVAIPLCRTPAERRSFQEAVVERIIARATGHQVHLVEAFIHRFLEVLRREGSSHLLRNEEVPAIIESICGQQ